MSTSKRVPRTPLRGRAAWMTLAWVTLVLGVSSVIACDTPDATRDVQTWRFAIEETRGSVQDEYAQRFKRRIEARTGGAVKVIVYPYGALGTSDHILEQLHNGTLDLAMSSPGHLGKLIPEVQVFLLHFSMSQDEAVNACALAAAEVRSALDTLYAEKGLRFLGAFSEGAMVWTTQKPVRAPDDFRHMRMRVMTSPLLIAAYEAYGAQPTPLPYSEVYGALQLHMIDGQVNPVFAIEEMSFYEVTEWLIFANHAYFVSTVAGSPAFLAKLDGERRTLVDQVIAELQLEIEQVQQRFARERLQRMREKKPSLQVLHLSEAERARFREAAKPVRDVYLELAGTRGAELMDVLQQATTRCAGAR